MELEGEGTASEEEGTRSGEELARLVVLFGGPEGEGMGLDQRGMRR
jgi:hypothetical protein